MEKIGPPNVFVIILNFNGKETLSDCLQSVFQSNYPRFEVAVVDNDSKDGSFEQAKESFLKAHFIKNSANLGFSRGNNVGIRWALEKFADYIFILNNDTIIEKTTLSALVKTMEKNSNINISSPVIFSPNNKIWFAGGKINWFKMKTHHLTEIKSDFPYVADYLSGCAMMIKKDVFKKTGLFDERFFLYYEDADFSVRAKKAGFDLFVVPSASILHLEASNRLNDLKLYWLVLSGLLFFQTNSSFLQKIWLVTYVTLRKIKNICDLIFFKKDSARLVRKAYRDYKTISK